MIPIQFGERLFALAPEPKQFVRLPNAGHSNILEQGGLGRVDAFLARIEKHLRLPVGSGGEGPPPQTVLQP